MRHGMILILSLGMALAVGCGSPGPKTAPVVGKVTVAGKPVTTGTVMFWPTGGGPPATGQIGPDGSYRLTTQPNSDGAVPGAHQVTIKAVQGEAGPKSFDEERAGKLGAASAQVQWLVPRRYEDRQTSPLTAEVKPGPNTIDFNLPAEK